METFWTILKIKCFCSWIALTSWQKIFDDIVEWLQLVWNMVVICGLSFNNWEVGCGTQIKINYGLCFCNSLKTMLTKYSQMPLVRCLKCPRGLVLEFAPSDCLIKLRETQLINLFSSLLDCSLLKKKSIKRANCSTYSTSIAAVNQANYF